MKRILQIAALIATLFTAEAVVVSAQNKFENKVSFDKTVNDFGDILVSDGPVSCTFTLTNISGKNIKISSVIPSCGCTDVTWTRGDINAGGQGTVCATFKNEDGPYPFDKSVSVYIDALKTPVVLRLRGIVHEKEMSLEELYGVHIGELGVREEEIKCGNLQQGQQKSGETTVANLGNSPLKLEFSELSQGLSLSVSPNPIPAHGTAKLTYTVTADRSKWGKNYYNATVVTNGTAQSKKISVWAITKENFSSWTKEQKENGANLHFSTSTYSFKPMAAGPTVKAVFEFTNTGKSELVIYKADADDSSARPVSVPSRVKAGAKGKIEVELSTKGMKDGEVLSIITLYTNSPQRPIVNLYITGFIK